MDIGFRLHRDARVGSGLRIAVFVTIANFPPWGFARGRGESFHDGTCTVHSR